MSALADLRHSQPVQREQRDQEVLGGGTEPGHGQKSAAGLLIDTNVVIHLAALDGSGLPDEMVISAVTLAELFAGPHHTSDPRNGRGG
jgi:hypothetical protein